MEGDVLLAVLRGDEPPEQMTPPEQGTTAGAEPRRLTIPGPLPAVGSIGSSRGSSRAPVNRPGGGSEIKTLDPVGGSGGDSAGGIGGESLIGEGVCCPLEQLV